MASPHIQSRNGWAAIICLLAVALLQAPFATAAWLSSGMACCIGDHCPVPGHHHKNVAGEHEMPMDCGQHGMHLSDCKISCCKTADATAINVAQFVMPCMQIVLSPVHAFSAISFFAPQMISRAAKPEPPPPRLTLS
jgi:hypothetical protein